MGLQHYLSAQCASPLYDRIKVFHLEPDQDTMPKGRRVRVDKVRMIFFVPGMELENQLLCL